MDSSPADEAVELKRGRPGSRTFCSTRSKRTGDPSDRRVIQTPPKSGNSPISCRAYALLMWHALDLAAAVGPVVRARLVVAHGVSERPPGFLKRFGFRAFDTDPRWCYLPMQDVEAAISAEVAPPHSITVMDRPASDR
jgi:hypothetical protein